MNKNYFIIFLVSLFMLASASLSYGGIFGDILKSPDKEETEIEGVLGIGALYATKPYVDVDEETFVIPLAILEYKDFWIDGRVFGYKFYQIEDVEFSIAGQPRLMGFDSSDSSFLAGMEDREWSFDGGLRVSWENELFELNVTGVTDLFDKHQGQELSAIISKELFQGFLTPRLGVKWLSESLVDYYYGVRGREGTAARPPHEGDSSANFVTGLTAALPLGERWAFVTDFEYENLGSDIEDSPIVDANEILTYVIGIVYRF